MIEYLAYLFGVIVGALALIFFIALVAELVSRDSQNPWQTFGRSLRFFLGTDNRRWAVLLGVAIFATFMALTHPGDGLVKPLEEKMQNDPLRKELNEVEERHYNLREYGHYRTNTEMCVTSSEFRENNSHICEPKKEARSWVWWWIAITFWIFLLIYTIPAFWDDVMRAGRRTYARLRAQAGGRAKFRPGNLIDRLFGGRGRQRGLETQTQPQAPVQPGTQSQHAMNFWSVMLASLVPEVFVNILEWMSKGRRR